MQRAGLAVVALAVGLGVVSGAMLVAVALQWRNPALVRRWPLPQVCFVVLDAATSA